MTPRDSFSGPRMLARALAEVARRADPDRAREAHVRAMLPGVLGAWLHARVEDVRVEGRDCILVMADDAASREVRAHAAEISRQLARRGGPDAPDRVRAETAPVRSPAPPRIGRALASPRDRPLTWEALADVADERLRRRLARWAGIDPER